MGNKLSALRLIAAAIVSPSLPIGLLAYTYASQTGSNAWYPVLFFFGYLFFILFGIPVVGALTHSRNLFSCAIAGGIVTVAPIFLIGIFSIFSNNQIFTVDMVLNLILLFLAGCFGGILFWGIAFAGSNKE